MRKLLLLLIIIPLAYGFYQGFKSEEVASTTPLTCVMPFSGGKITGEGEFHARRDQNASGLHQGLDIEQSIGTEIKAILPGTVIGAGFSVPSNPESGHGLRVVIRHPDGTMSLYAHLAQARVVKDQKVNAGDVIGTIGITGNANSRRPHLHLEIGDVGSALGGDRKYLNPQKFLEACGAADPNWRK